MPFIFLALGIGLIGWYGLEWWELPRYSEADLDASVEANLAVDLSRLEAGLKPEPSEMQRRRAQLRLEIQEDIQRERADSERGLGVGLLCVVVSLGNAVFARGMAKK